MKKILLTLTLFTVFSATTVLATDLDEVKSRVVDIQTTDTGLPTISEQKGTVGTIIALIFNGATGKIKSMFLEFGIALSPDDIPRWDGVDFVTSEITDDGTNVGIGTTPNATDKLKINGNLLVTNKVKALELCDIAGTECFNPDPAVSGGWASLASAIWGLNGTNVFYNGGNVGIGTNLPTAKLEVTGDETNASTAFEPIIKLGGADGDFAQFYRDNNGTNNYLGIESYEQGTPTTKTPIVLQEFGGKVGIGTTVPAGKLEVKESGLGLSLNQSSANDIYMRYHVPGVRWWTVGPKANGDFRFSNSPDHASLAAMEISSGGNVGIGTTNPGQKLDVNGTINATGDITMKDDTPTTYYLDQNNRSAMIHVNSNRFYILRGDGVGSTTWTPYNGQRPMRINLENNYSYFGGNMTVKGAVKTTCIGNCF